ncbi:Alanine racemase, partial [Lamellibrachia satsuma]
GAVNIKIDSGMSRYGCQPDELRHIIQSCEDLDVPIDSMFTHFADSPGDAEFTRQQLDIFQEAVEPFRNKNISLHVANSGAILNGVGTDLDFIRPGIAMYGFPPGRVADFTNRGFQPAASIKAIPSLVKRLSEGRKVGYGYTYTTGDGEWLATFPLGYADGYFRLLSNNGFIVRDRTGEKCPIVGRVSMDAITVRLPCCPDDAETYTIMTADFDLETSATGIASKTGTILPDVLSRLSTFRYPRVYIADQSLTIISGLHGDIY